MAEKQKKSRKQKSKERRTKFKQFLKRNMTPTWAKRFSYQVIAFLISVAMIIGVATYAFNKSYDERTLTFVEGFTITAHTGAFNTEDNSIESLQTAIDHDVQIFELDVRQRPNGTLVMGHDLITTNNDGVELTTAFDLIKDTHIKLNLDIKETRLLSTLHNLILQYNMQDQVFLTGIEIFETDKVKENCPDIEYYINYIPSRLKIFSEDYQKKILDLLEETGAIGINCKHIYASRTLSNLLHKNGYKLSVWTVDKSYQIKRALINSPDNITTHDPEKIQKAIKNWGK